MGTSYHLVVQKIERLIETETIEQESNELKDGCKAVHWQASGYDEAETLVWADAEDAQMAVALLPVWVHRVWSVDTEQRSGVNPAGGQQRWELQSGRGRRPAENSHSGASGGGLWSITHMYVVRSRSWTPQLPLF